jgi:hypothetical protein
MPVSTTVAPLGKYLCNIFSFCFLTKQAFIVKLLLDCNANPTIRDRFGRKPSGRRASIFVQGRIHRWSLLSFLEVCSSNSSIRSVLLKAEYKFDEQRQRAEQSDDSLEEERQEIVDSLSEDDHDADDDSEDLFSPIPQRRAR